MDELEETAEISASEDEDGNDKNHLKLLDAISFLDGKKKPRLYERTVHTSQISEFNFTTPDESKKVNISELLGSLTSGKHAKLKKQLKSVEKNDKVVPVPLPKHEKQKIDRSVAYQQTSKEVGKWDSIVQTNRLADQLTFPLEKPMLKLYTTGQQISTTKPRNSLERQVAALINQNVHVPSKKKELTPAEEKALKAMDLEEARERLAELRKYRALLSYKESKAKWQKRIKSKKYHRVLKKEKLKNEKKSLEELQKTDPEAYVEKLKAAEIQRVEERMSLKHRGGSKQMKKQMIYGKYNDQARQAVQDMIQKNKELTQKTEVFSDSDSEGGVSMDSEDEMNMIESAVSSSGNPWMKSTKLPKPSGFEPVPEVKNLEKIHLSDEEENESENRRILSSVVEKVIIEDDIHTVKTKEEKKDNEKAFQDHEQTQMEDYEGSEDIGQEFKPLKKDDLLKIDSEIKDNETFKESSQLKTEKMKNDRRMKGNEKVKQSRLAKEEEKKIDSEFEVNKTNKEAKIKKEIKDNNKSSRDKKVIIDDIDELFEEFEKGNKKNTTETKSKSVHEKVMIDGTRKKKRNLAKRAKRKQKRIEKENLKKEIEEKQKEKLEEQNEEVEEESFISETLDRKKTVEDFEGDTSEEETANTFTTKNKNLAKTDGIDNSHSHRKDEVYVDPKKLLTLESKIDKTKLPDMMIEDDDDDNEDLDDEERQRMTIAQAFADDDVIDEFTQEKKDIVERDKPKDIDLSLPGWGEWGGEGLKMSKKKRKRFTIKAPPAPPRKDSHLGNVIISEQKDKAISKFQVSDLPFPFVSVKQFEQSIQAPIGKNWNPETAYRDLIKPKVTTQLGTIISPMDKEELFKKQKSKRKADINLDTQPKNWKNKKVKK